MKNQEKTKNGRAVLPEFLPHGWKKEVAAALGVHRNTVNHALQAGSGPTYDRIRLCAAAKYGRAK